MTSHREFETTLKKEGQALEGKLEPPPGDGNMNVIINGKKEDIPAQSIAAYIGNRGLDPKTLVVEHNGQVIVADQWEGTLLQEGDLLELLSFVGGG